MLRPRLSGNLWHHRDFTRFWFSDTVSQFGSQFSGFALPVLAVLTFDATPLDIGIITALAIIPYPLLGLFVGVWADRFRKRRIMLICNIGRMLTLGSVPVGFYLGFLSLAQIFVVSLVSGTFSVFFDISYQAYLPVLVERKDLIEGNQKLQLSASAAQVAGPGVAGYVYQAIGGAYTVASDAIGYFISAIVLASIRTDEPQRQRSEGERQPDFFAEMREGIDVVLRNRYLATIAGSTATSNLGSNMVFAVTAIFALRLLHFTTGEYGVVLSIASLGFLVGALFVGRVTARLGLGRALAVAIFVPVVMALYPLALLGYSFEVAAAVSFVGGLAVPVYNINQISLRQAIVPQRLQGRMNATMRVIVWGTIPLGSLLGGLLGDSIGVVDTIYIGAVIAGLAALWILLGPVVRLREQPEPLVE